MKNQLVRSLLITGLTFPLLLNMAHGQADTSIWNGVYSEDQAVRGKEVYDSVCASCHSPDLRGNSTSPSLTGMSFMFLWEGRSLGEFFTTIQTRMPSENPNSLPARSYRDVVAYILQVNNFPAGDVEISSNVDLLNQIQIQPQ